MYTELVNAPTEMCISLKPNGGRTGIFYSKADDAFSGNFILPRSWTLLPLPQVDCIGSGDYVEFILRGNSFHR